MASDTLPELTRRESSLGDGGKVSRSRRIFSLTYTGEIKFDSHINPATLSIHLQDCLRRADARAIEVEGYRVRFTAGLFRFVSNWNVLAPFEFGDLTVDPQARLVHYCLSFRQLVIMATAMVAFVTAYVLLGLFASLSLSWQPALFIPLMWVWLVGGNLAIAIPRFQNFLCRSIAGAPRLNSEPVEKA